MYRAIIFSVLVTLIASLTAFAGPDDKDFYSLKAESTEESPCSFSNPLKDLYWLKTLHKKNPNYTICMFKKNGKVLFKIFRCGKSQYPVTWYDCQGHKVCPGLRTTCSAVQGARLYRCLYEGCDLSGTSERGKCEGDAWFKYPSQRTYPQGSDIYVLVSPKKYRDIAAMELYVNGKFIRKETQYPFEWCKGTGTSDKYLRNMKPGSYKLMCVIKTKCGEVRKEYRLFEIK